MARKVYLRKDLGVGALRKQFGGRNKRKGTVPEHFAKASGGILRHILLQLEELQLVEKSTTLKGGRWLLAFTRLTFSMGRDQLKLGDFRV